MISEVECELLQMPSVPEFDPADVSDTQEYSNDSVPDSLQTTNGSLHDSSQSTHGSMQDSQTVEESDKGANKEASEGTPV